jgi:DNA-binding NtrC family response regulator
MSNSHSSGEMDKPPLPPSLKPGSETILFVEDDESLRNVISDFLTELGYKMLIAKNSKEALDLASSHTGTIHLLLTDVVMSPLSGPELAKQIRSSHTGIKVLYISGYSQEVLSPRQNVEPDAPLLQKPFTIKLLSAKLREVLDKS